MKKITVNQLNESCRKICQKNYGITNCDKCKNPNKIKCEKILNTNGEKELYLCDESPTGYIS